MTKNEIISTKEIPRIPDWENHLKSHQHVESLYFTAGADEKELIYGNYSEEVNNQAYGCGVAAMLTQITFTYFGGLYQARKQFIPGYLYFLNRHFNFVSGLKYLAAGFIFGKVISIFAFGHPFLVEDHIRRKLRKLTDPQIFEVGRFDV
jgi:hypothetical protein